MKCVTNILSLDQLFAEGTLAIANLLGINGKDGDFVTDHLQAWITVSQFLEKMDPRVVLYIGS